MTLNELIPAYGVNKAELDGYKKICDKQNAEIKKIMLENKMDSEEVDGWKATCTVSTRESFNEAVLLEIAHNHDISEIIKTKEYIDYDALENAIYNGKISDDILLEMNKARDTKEVVTLKIRKVKTK